MKKMKLLIIFDSEWAISTGAGSRMLSDTEVSRDENGLPMIPGRTLKGILRDALKDVPTAEGSVEALFGTKPDIADKVSTKGRLRIGTATVNDAQELFDSGMDRHSIRNAFTQLRAQTKIDTETGSAQHGSLRTIEVAIGGLELVAEVELPEDYLDMFRTAAVVVRRLGSGRSRGLGYCTMAVAEVGQDFESARNATIEAAKKYVEANK